MSARNIFIILDTVRQGKYALSKFNQPCATMHSDIYSYQVFTIIS